MVKGTHSGTARSLGPADAAERPDPTEPTKATKATGQATIAELLDRVRAWVAIDPDPETRAEAERLLGRAEAGDLAATDCLRDAFQGRLRFGTAGLRAEMGAGPRRMNRVVVSQSSAGLASYLIEQAGKTAASTSTSTHARTAEAVTASPAPRVVVGYDARTNSAVFARDTAEILAGAGLSVTLFADPVPTPVTAFAVRHLDAAAGVMITASHNPPRDNGYKVYLGGADGGTQIITPADREIAAHIARAAARPLAGLPRSRDYELASRQIVQAYVEANAAAARLSAPDAPSAPQHHPQQGAMPHSDRQQAKTQHNETFSVVYTAMHGVGAELARRVFEAAGLPETHPVEAQDKPDGGFPTLAYPNPEEPGALDLAYAAAYTHGASLVIANDPDADRLGVAAFDPSNGGGFRALTGNEIGLLLGWRAARRARARSAKTGTGTTTGTLANTIVSSPALGAVARHYGFDHVETLSGSKWLARVPNLIFGFEEALGYLVHPDIVGDKDGIAAAAEMIALAQECHSVGRSLWNELDQASMLFGHFESRQVVVRRGHADDVRAISEWVRTHPPTGFGWFGVARVRDFRTPGLAPVSANILAYDLADGSRVMIRPSGTEPKLKVYIDAFSYSGSLDERQTATTTALDSIEAGVRDYLDRARP